MSCSMIKNATVQLPEIQVVRMSNNTKNCEPTKARQGVHLPREVAPDGNGGSSLKQARGKGKTEVLAADAFAAALEAVPAEDWCRTWAAGRTIML